jgi:hypothetical protein
VFLFFAGFTAGAALSAFLFIGARESQPKDDRTDISRQAERWRNQHPFPPV